MCIKIWLWLSLFIAASECARLPVPVAFKISGSELPNMDTFNGAPDPYVQVYYAEGSTSELYRLIGQTQKLSGTQNPVFPDIFQKNFVFGAHQRIRLEVWDSDFESKHDYMGRVELTLAELAGLTSGSVLQKVIQRCAPEKAPCGRLLITRQ